MRSITKQWKWFIVPALMAVALGLWASFAVAQDGDRAPPMSDQGLTEEQRDAKYRSLAEEDERRKLQWATDFVESGQSLNDLPRSESLVFVASTRDFDATVTESSTIFTGTVRDQRLEIPNEQVSSIVVVSTISIESVSKGSVGASIELEHRAHLELGQDGVMRLIVSPNNAPPYGGARILAFARQAEGSERLTTIPYKLVRINDGRTEVYPGDELMADVDGARLDDVLARINEILSRSE